MAIEFDHIDDLIGKVLSNEASAEEIREVEDWRNASSENAKYFADMEVIFAKAASINFDEDAAWKKVQTKLKKQKAKSIYWSPMRIAAGILLVFVLGISTTKWLIDEHDQPVAIASQNSVRKDTLPDASTVVLNKRSEITYEYDKTAKTRKVKLKGEGFFDVKHDEKKPFVIEVEEALVRDIGTSFNIKSNPEKDTIEVLVQSGVVQFYTASDPGMLIMAGETGIYSKRAKTFTRIPKADTNVLAYKTRVFSFHATDLRSVIEQINEVYDSKITLGNNNIAGCQLTVTFRNDTLDNIVEVIAETLSLTIDRTDKNEIILNGQGCR